MLVFDVTKKEKKLLSKWKKSLKKGEKPRFKSLKKYFFFNECLFHGILKYPTLGKKEKTFKEKLLR